MSKKKYGICGKCGEFIRYFKWVLPNWLCQQCYDERFPERPGASAQGSLENLFDSEIPGEESMEFLAARLYDKPELYNAGFEAVKARLKALRRFRTLKQLRDACARRGPKFRSKLRQALVDLGHWQRKDRQLFQRIVEILLFVVWVDIEAVYGEDNFSEGYWELIHDIVEPPVPQIKPRHVVSG